MKAKLTPTYAFAAAHKSLLSLSLSHTCRPLSSSLSSSLLCCALLPFCCCFPVPFFRWPQCGGARVKLYARLKLRRMSMMSTVRVNSWRTRKGWQPRSVTLRYVALRSVALPVPVLVPFCCLALPVPVPSLTFCTPSSATHTSTHTHQHAHTHTREMLINLLIVRRCLPPPPFLLTHSHSSVALFRFVCVCVWRLYVLSCFYASELLLAPLFPFLLLPPLIAAPATMSLSPHSIPWEPFSSLGRPMPEIVSSYSSLLFSS